MIKFAEQKQKGAKKRVHFEDASGKRDYFDYLYKPPASTSMGVPIMC
jgi:hypothetical protein